MSPPSFFNQGAERYAPEIFPKAQSSLQAAENVLAQDSGKNYVLHDGQAGAVEVHGVNWRKTSQLNAERGKAPILG